MPAFGHGRFGLSTFGGTRMRVRSHRTQDMQNYFDANDIRVRQLPHTVDAQTLNLAAVQLDDLELKMGRETQARTLARCPVQIDNRGVYWAVRLPGEVEVPDSGVFESAPTGVRGQDTFALAPYDDLLPVPARIEVDRSRPQVALPSPILFTAAGSEGEYMYNGGKLVIPNRLTFLVDGLGLGDSVSVQVEGERAPRPVWPSQRFKSGETIFLDSNGTAESLHPWALIDLITVRGLPEGATLTCYQMPFGIAYVRDDQRPVAIPSDRDQRFTRYWTLEHTSRLLKEVFVGSNLNGYDYVQSRSYDDDLRDVAVEPHTWGLVAVSGNKLFYLDRREPMPAGLDKAAPRVEPLWGLKVSYNVNKPGATRYALLEPFPNAKADDTLRWRYLMEDPAGNLWAVLPNGSFSPYSSAAGWQAGGRPKTMSVPLYYLDDDNVRWDEGTYTFTLETSDGQALTEDIVPYLNMALGEEIALDLSTAVMDVKGVAFDYRGNLWVWTGDYAVPLRLYYDGYVIEPDYRLLLLTDSYDEVRFA